MKIAFLQADDYACGNYRIRNIARMLNRTKKAECRIFKSILAFNDLLEYDVVIMQRSTHDNAVDFVKRLKEHGILVIQETDDLLEGVDKWNPAYLDYPPNSKQTQNYLDCLRLADGIITATPALAWHYRKLNKNISIYPNYIDYDLRTWETVNPSLDDKVRIGFTGSTSHLKDLELIVEPLSIILDKYTNVEFYLFAHEALKKYMVKLGLADDKIKLIEPCDFKDYPEKLDFDIALIPLQTTAFNKCKSDLKIKEMIAKGITVVASDIEPYRRFLNDNIMYRDILLVSDKCDAWVAGIESLINSELTNFNYAFRDGLDLSKYLDDYLKLIKAIQAGNANSGVYEVFRNERCKHGIKFKRCGQCGHYEFDTL